MKKFLALLLAVMMIASMSVTAFAADTVTDSQDKTDELQWNSNGDTTDGAGTANNDTTSTNDVVVKLVDEGTQIVPVYYVTVDWAALNFTFKFAEGVKWNPEKHEYQDAAGTTNNVGAWYVGNTEGSSVPNAIVVTNHSDAVVYITAAFDTGAEKTTNGVKATIANATERRTIATAEGTAFGNAPSTTYAVSVANNPTTKSDFKLGTITVTFSAT